ncbi:MAG: hypothetical protein IPH37_16620 [Burkholderiales bacterium]|nr:hypothetical protein [Burkholderiales bacterium]
MGNTFVVIDTFPRPRCLGQSPAGSIKVDVLVLGGIVAGKKPLAAQFQWLVQTFNLDFAGGAADLMRGELAAAFANKEQKSAANASLESMGKVS